MEKALWEIDFRLVDVSMELYALEDHLELLEKHIEHTAESERLIRDDAIRKYNSTPNDPEWHEAHQNYDHKIDFLLPRFFRGPFLVSLYAVYESAVTEIARLIQKKQGQAISISDIKGEFLNRAKKYYKHILRFEFCDDNTAWQYLTMLSILRNAFAHTNGRIEMLKDSAKQRIIDWEKKRIGLQTNEGYIIIDANLLKKIFHIPPNLVVERVPAHRKPPDVRIWRLSNQSCVGTFPPSTSTPHWPACWARR